MSYGVLHHDAFPAGWARGLMTEPLQDGCGRGDVTAGGQHDDSGLRLEVFLRDRAPWVPRLVFVVQIGVRRLEARDGFDVLRGEGLVGRLMRVESTVDERLFVAVPNTNPQRFVCDEAEQILDAEHIAQG